MPRVEIYTKSWCPHCFRAKAVLDAKGVEYDEIDVEEQPEREAEMLERAGGAVRVPQIFIDDRHVGDADTLGKLFDSGQLDVLLGLDG